jgi:hypothetical protein
MGTRGRDTQTHGGLCRFPGIEAFGNLIRWGDLYSFFIYRERDSYQFFETVCLGIRWYGIRLSDRRPEMDTLIFADHGIIVLAITTIAIALVLSVLGLTTTQRERSEIERQLLN